MCVFAFLRVKIGSLNHVVIEFKQILVLILDHIQSTVDWLSFAGTNLFLQIDTGPITSN